MSFAMKYVSVTSRRMIKTVTSVPCVLSLRKFNGCNHDLVNRDGVSVSQITTVMFRLSEPQSVHFLIHDLSPVTQRVPHVEQELTNLPEHLS
jgi:hypothetical protein